MYIESIKLCNFRNYESLDLELDSGTNIFYGDNAQGKTNILESAYLCGTSRSHRGSRDQEMIRFGEEEAHIRMMVRKNDISGKIDMHLRRNKTKGVAIDGIPIKKARELMGAVNLVFFSPEDLNIIKNGPAERRRFLDSELCQLDRIYLSDLAGYNHALLQRNRLLKDLVFHPELLDTLDVWDEQLCSYGRRVIAKRMAFVEELNGLVRGIHQELTGRRENLEVIYEPDSGKEKLLEKLRDSRERDRHLKTTTVGPHRDDFRVSADGMDIRRFGSQGQQRTAALSLKLSEIYLVKKRISDTPVLLLDDVLSELDKNRQSYLLNCLGNIQTLITCTGLDEFVSRQFQINRTFLVRGGRVTCTKGKN